MGARDVTADELAEAESIEAAIWAEFMAPPPLLTVTQWAELHSVSRCAQTGVVLHGDGPTNKASKSAIC